MPFFVILQEQFIKEELKEWMNGKKNTLRILNNMQTKLNIYIKKMIV